MCQRTLVIGIVHWNTPQLLIDQLQRLSSFAGVEVVVVSNSFQKGLARRLQTDFPDVTFIQNLRNRGFAHAANQIALHSHADWLLFLNPDATMTISEIKRLLKYAKNHHLAATSPMDSSKNYQKPLATFWSLVVEFTPIGKVVPLSLFRTKTLVGGHILIHGSVLRKIGGWDERFFIWFEDTDLTKKLQKFGFEFSVSPDIHVQHKGASSVSLLTREMQRQMFFLSLQLYADKHFSFLERWLIRFLVEHYSHHALLPTIPQIEVSMIVPNLRKDLLTTFLETNIRFFDFRKHELIIVTGAHNITDLRQKYADVIFIEQHRHDGFAHNVNTGMRRACGAFIGTVNDDTVLQSQWLTLLLAQFDAQTASVSPLILHKQGEVETCGVNILPQGRAVLITAPAKRVHSDAFNGACVIFNRAALNQVGLFDERFESYLEDLDLGLRFTRAGWKNIATDVVSITHFGHQTSQSMQMHRMWLNVRNWWYVLIKNYSLQDWMGNASKIFVERTRNIFSLVKKPGADKKIKMAYHQPHPKKR